MQFAYPVECKFGYPNQSEIFHLEIDEEDSCFICK